MIWVLGTWCVLTLDIEILDMDKSVVAEISGALGDRVIVPRPQFRADIEGLRAIAILMVVAYHAGIPGFGGGYVGVDIFFVISGYLITWLLVYEIQEKNKVNLIRFYARRVRRLLPALAFMLLVTVSISAILYAPLEQENLARTAFTTATYSSNLYFAQTAVDYLAADLKSNPLLHAWSLSVEEQFYIVWPLFVMFVLGALFRRQRSLSRLNIILWMSAITMGSFALSLYLTEVRQPFAFFLSPSRTWEFSVGALAVLVPTGSIKTIVKAEVWGWLGLGGVLSAAFFFSEATRFPGVAAVLPTVATAVILRAGSVSSETRLAQFLGLRGFQSIGSLSYSWYLWHWPVLVFAGVIMASPPLVVRVGLVILALIPAVVSYRWIENPIRHSNFFSRLPMRSIALGVLITAFCVFLSLGWIKAATQWSYQPEQRAYARAANDRPVVYDNGCHADYFTQEPKVEGCTVGPADASLEVVLFGDSHAAQWYSALAQLLDTQKWHLTSMTKSGCPYVTTTIFNSNLGRTYTECDIWRKNVLGRIQEIDPDLVIVTSSSGYPLNPAEWTAATARTLSSLTETSRQVVVLRDTPKPDFNVPICLARNAWRPFGLFQSPCKISTDQTANEEVYAAQEAAAEPYKRVSTVDMQSYICSDSACELQREQTLVYKDASHLSLEFALTLAPNLYNELNAVLLKNNP